MVSKSGKNTFKTRGWFYHSLYICLSYFISAQCYADDITSSENVTFEKGFMSFYNSNIDLTQFNGIDKILPGDYTLEVYSNRTRIDTWKVKFIQANNPQGVNACMTPDMVVRFDIDTSKLPENWKLNSCIILPTLIPGATVTYNQSDEQLDVTVPQAALLNTPDGYVNPELWDNGVPALIAGYTASASSGRNRVYDDTTDNAYGSLQTALSLGAWRFVTYDSASFGSDGSENGIQHIQSYAERAIAPLSASFTAGDLTTAGEFFNTSAVRGIRLATDDRMLPDSVRNYAPVVRGVANSNATVTIKQAGNTIFEKVIPPGEFVISDLYATGYNGDLDVTITETDGSQNTFTVPYSSIPQLIRQGYSRYAVTTGEIRNTGLNDSPYMMEGTLQYGLLNNLTTYVGAQHSPDINYTSLITGVAFNTPVGAVGVDISRSITDISKPDNKNIDDSCNQFCEMSLRISLAKNFPQTGTNFSLMGYRYASPDYYSLDDAISIKRSSENNDYNYYPKRYRERLEANINQKLPEGWGSFYINGFVGNVWNEELARQERSNFSIGYNNYFGRVSWGIAYGRTNDEDGNNDDVWYLNFSMPLGHDYEKKARLGVNFSYDSDATNFRTSLNGSAGEYSQFGFGGYFSQSSQAETNAGMNLTYTGESMSNGIAISQSRDSYMGSINTNGGVVIHSGGINFTPTFNDTIGIIEAQGAEGSHIYPDNRSVIKSNGYGIVGYLTPYKYNEVYLDPKGTSMDVDVEDTHKTIVPTAGAAILVKMGTKQQNQTFVQFISPSQKSLPFGAQIANASGDKIGMVGQNGLAMIVTEPGKNVLSISWKEGDTRRSCQAEYNNQHYDTSVNDDKQLNATVISCKE